MPLEHFSIRVYQAQAFVSSRMLLLLILVASSAFPQAIGIAFNAISSNPHSRKDWFDYNTESAIEYTKDGGRTGHVLGLWPITNSDGIIETTNLVHYYAAAYMAMEHFNSRSGAVIPELPELLQGCDFQLTTEVWDDQRSIQSAVIGLEEALYPVNATNMSQPFAVLGSLTSAVSLPLAIVNDANNVVQISGMSTSTQLDSVHLFTRTIPTNQGDAAAFIAYFNSIGVDRIGILYVRDAYGDSFNNVLLSEARKSNIEVTLSLSFDESGARSVASMETSMELLKINGVRYIIGILGFWDWKPVLRVAHQYGIIGGSSGCQWYIAEHQAFLEEDFALAAEEEDLADALHGVGVLHIHVEKNPAFEKEFSKFHLAEDDSTELIDNTTMRDRFISSHLEPGVYEAIEFMQPQTSIFTYFMYDTMMALGFAACQTPGLFTTNEFFTKLINSEFPGLSGWVSLDRTTGSRLAQDVKYNLENVLLSTRASTNASFRFSSPTSVTIQGTNITQHPHQFVFADNSTAPLSALPASAAYEYNLIPTTALAVGWTLAGLVLLMSVACIAGTICNRHTHIVRVSQPLFLCQLCVGTFVMALAIIPLGMQEQLLPDGSLYSKWNLDAACMAVPWLFCTGFAASISAILSKTIRLYKVMKNSMGMRRIVVRERDVLQPLIVMLALNVGLLLACNLAVPFTWQRNPVKHNVDRYGRSLESCGSCQQTSAQYFMLFFFFVNFGGILVAAFQCYKARHLPTEMSENDHLLVATVSLMEVFLIGAPILLLRNISPTAQFLVQSSVICLSCFSILIPIFVPKFLQRNARPIQPGRRHLVQIHTVQGMAKIRSAQGLVTDHTLHQITNISDHTSHQITKATHVSGQASDWLGPSSHGSMGSSPEDWGKMSVIRHPTS